MFNSNAIWWYEYKYDNSPVDNSCYIIYIKHVHVFIHNNMWRCTILHIFHTNAIIFTHLQEVNTKNNININKYYYL